MIIMKNKNIFITFTFFIISGIYYIFKLFNEVSCHKIPKILFKSNSKQCILSIAQKYVKLMNTIQNQFNQMERVIFSITISLVIIRLHIYFFLDLI